MGIRFILLVNKQGQTRLAQYYEYLTIEQRRALEGEIVRRCLARNEQQCSFVEHRNYKIVYRRYASLFFLVGVDNDENELAILEFIHLLVETMDRLFGNVCELDIMFHLEKVHFMLEEMIMNGCKDDKAENNGMFVFGSSLVDNGNNNFVENATSKADYMPYGVDFPQGPSGRFSNGKNVIDALGQLLKLPSLIPAFKHPNTKGNMIVHGVDFASGGSGILDETGSVAGRVITLNQQIKNFEEITLPELKAQLGNTTLSKYLFVVGSGGNDYLLNYFLPTNPRKISLPDFTANLTQSLSTQIQKLHSLGARKFVLVSVYPLGCIPFVKKTFWLHPGCMIGLNEAALLFNRQLKSLVNDLKPKLPGSNLMYIDTYNIIKDILDNPSPKGFNDTENTCCEVPSFLNGGNGILCKRDGSACGNRGNYVFFDGLHPTEAVNDIIANKAYTSNLETEVFPMNVQQLAQIQQVQL
ncbi:GDSL esterase/lipase [Thalictrum thalictroides]|uniref:GDSL esterase/lipase n=1 Tax=Thalictrum thalictroides TaxID=46969 RepID=A0A7J6XGP1_THATH|nr:GDSL esterase/lipase [Thalictrum thalictroides]